MNSPKYYLTFKGFWQRCRQEYLYYTRRPWSLKQVGEFWDSVEDYDGVNETLYPHERRFSNSYLLAAPYLPRNDYLLLDVETRTGKPTFFWHTKNKIKKAVCVDFSDQLLTAARNRLKNRGLDFDCIKIDQLPLPFPDRQFDFVCSYETVEHVFDYEKFIKELTRVMRDDGIMIITCPNAAWEWVHWLSAALNINHSEGPHRFLRRKILLRCFEKNDLRILAENTTIFLPFNKKLSIAVDRWLEKNLPVVIRRLLGLRRTFILQKDSSHGSVACRQQEKP